MEPLGGPERSEGLLLVVVDYGGTKIRINVFCNCSLFVNCGIVWLHHVLLLVQRRAKIEGLHKVKHKSSQHRSGYDPLLPGRAQRPQNIGPCLPHQNLSLHAPAFADHSEQSFEAGVF